MLRQQRISTGNYTLLHLKIQPCFCSPLASPILLLSLDMNHFGCLQSRKINAGRIRTLGCDWSHKRLLQNGVCE